MSDLFDKLRVDYFESETPIPYGQVKEIDKEEAFIRKELKTLYAMRALQEEFEDNFELSDKQTIAHYQRIEYLRKQIWEFEEKLHKKTKRAA